MMVNRHKDMQETCMCWGFACGDGWFNILNQLMSNIQHHIDWKEKQREYAIEYNKIAHQCKEGNFELFEKSMDSAVNQEYKNKRLAEIIAGDFRAVPESIPQVTLDQVKEKFGTLRFYYTGGDDEISGMVRMAESWASKSCEECGNVGKRSGEGWVRTLCDFHIAEREALRAEQMKKEGFEIAVANDGDEALAKVASFKPNLMLLDVMMPKKSGFEVCEALRADPARAGLKIVMLTAKGRDTEVAKGLAIGADAYVTKPFSTKELVAMVKAMLGVA